jgi:hypothetical protein
MYLSTARRQSRVTLAAGPGTEEKLLRSGLRPRQDSNLRTRLRRAALYPLSYEGLNPS